jgi:hypothetical protein
MALKRLHPDFTTSRAAKWEVVVLLLISCRTLLLYLKPVWHPNRHCAKGKDWNKINVTIVKF